MHVLNSKAACLFSDLSFNNIEVVEGLGMLEKLEDLTLYNNRISTLENMDSLTKLNVFSIGNNNLGTLENVSQFLYKPMTIFLENLSLYTVCSRESRMGD